MGMFLRRGPAPHRTRMSDLEIGRSIKLNLNGTPWDWLVVHQGLPSDIYDASCNGTWLLLKNIYELRQWHSSNVNDYENSTIHSHLNSTFLALLDSDKQNAIKQIKLPYVKGTGKGAVASGANGLPCKVFLLGGYEVGWTTSDDTYFPQDGAKLDYFAESTVGNSLRIAQLNGMANLWWLRSAYTRDTGSAWRVKSNGTKYTQSVSGSRGIRPAIILPSNFIVTDDMLA